MKILAVSDEESPALWDHYVPGRLDEYDLIISCGDLKASYLTFLATMSHARVLYVHGNHDGSYLSSPPEGCDCIDGHLVVYNGVRILGLGGCRRYCPGEHQYSESQMRRRIARLRYALWRSGGVDIVVTHTSPRGFGDMEDPAHRGFESFVELIDRYHPSLLLHGHTHLRYQPGVSRELTRGSTGIINVSERYTLELSAASPPPSERDRLIWKTRHRDSGSSLDYFSL
ncbi:MAG: metallophosphoesterase family protein [Oscillospiraceae bacterium]|nr:metallophosphoesterase family protein [Oscillospiraceae bacterium]